MESSQSPSRARSRSSALRGSGARRVLPLRSGARGALGAPALCLAWIGALASTSCSRPGDAGLFEPGGGSGGRPDASAGSGGSDVSGAGGEAPAPDGDSGTGAGGAGGPEDASAPGADGGRTTPKDADAQSDALLDGALSDGAPPCGGLLTLGVCWYLGEPAQSCAAACADRGGPDAAAIAIIGSESQGGSPEGCRTVLLALGLDEDEAVASGTRNDGAGVGCHLFGLAQDAWWLSSPDHSPSASHPQARIACGCAS